MDTCWNRTTKSYAEQRWASFCRKASEYFSNALRVGVEQPEAAEPRETPHFPPRSTPTFTSNDSNLRGKRVGMVMFSAYPADPRPRRAVSALVQEGMHVDLICLVDGKNPQHEALPGVDVFRLAVTKYREGKLLYALQYSMFILLSGLMLARRAFKRRYDVIYVHNMPDILVIAAVVPKLLGAKVILDQHDPMPELMTTIFNYQPQSFSVRLIAWLEKWSMARADLVLTVNIACKRIFASRSCRAEKIGVVMNAPDGEIFPFQPACEKSSSGSKQQRPFVIMYHGSLVERNGLQLAVEALARVRDVVPTAELRIYGYRSPYLERVIEEVRQKSLEERVHYLGSRRLEDLVPEIANCDVGVIPNQRSAFADINTPTRIFEYLALGKPVIAPRTEGILDYFGPDSLFLFEAGKADDLAEQMAYVYFHPTEAVETARRGQQIYSAHTWSKERHNLVDLMVRLLS